MYLVYNYDPSIEESTHVIAAFSCEGHAIDYVWEQTGLNKDSRFDKEIVDNRIQYIKPDVENQ
jgi:hypothetical protein